MSVITIIKGRTETLAKRNKVPTFLKHQMIGMLTNWTLEHTKRGIRGNNGEFIHFTVSDFKVIAYLILKFMNQKTGACYPNQATIGAKVNLSRRRVCEAIGKWRRVGVLGVVKRKCLKPSTGKSYPLNTSCFYHLTKNIYNRLKHAIDNKFAFLLQFKPNFKTIVSAPQKMLDLGNFKERIAYAPKKSTLTDTDTEKIPIVKTGIPKTIDEIHQYFNNLPKETHDSSVSFTDRMRDFKNRMKQRNQTKI